MQFFYERRQPVQPKAGDTEVTFESFTDSFNMNMVIRTFEYEKGKIFVLLNDGHEESKEYEAPDSKGKMEVKRMRQWLASEIYLNEEDTKRYRSEAGSTVPSK